MRSASKATEDLIRAYRHVFSTPEGRVVLEDILKRVCGRDRPVFAPDQLALAYNAACHDVGLQIEKLARGDLQAKQPEVIR